MVKTRVRRKAKKATVVARQPAKMAPRQRTLAVARTLRTLDANAVAWARLMDDPCNAPLVYPCFSSAGGGTVLMRVEYDQVLFSGATETAGIYLWAPGASLSLINNTALTGDGAFSVLGGANGPGSQWFPSNATAIRAVAGCIQVMYPGTELNRSGIVAIGVVPADTFVINVATANGGGNVSTSTALLRSTCAHSERMPSGMVEAKWFPGENDQATISGNLGTTWANVLQGRNALAVAVSGFPVSTGVRVRAVGVFEVSLYGSANIGAVQQPAPPQSSNTSAQVIREMFQRDPKWWLNTATNVGKAIGTTISYASAGVKAAGRIVNGMALIAA